MALYSAPPVPNYTKAATSDVTTARPNQVTPFGSSTWVPPTTPGGQWTQKTALTPAEQAALSKQQGIDQGLSTGAAGMTPWAVSNTAGPIDYSKFNAGGAAVQGGNYYDKAAGDAVYKQFSDRMEPQFARDTAAAQTQMRNQGLSPGDEAWQDQMRQLEQSQGDQRMQAQENATSTAATEGSRMQSMDTAAGTYNTAQRQSQIADELQKRGYGVDEINAMLNGHTVGLPNMPNTPGQGSQYTNALGDTYGAQLDSSNAKNASTGSWLNLAGKVGSNIIDNYGKGGLVDKAASWLGFNPAGATASTSAASAAGAAGLTDMGGAAAANMAALPAVDMGITSASLAPAAATAAEVAAPVAAAAPAAGAGGAAAAGVGSTAGAVVGGVGMAALLAYEMGHGQPSSWYGSLGTNSGAPADLAGKPVYRQDQYAPAGSIARRIWDEYMKEGQATTTQLNTNASHTGRAPLQLK